MSAAVPTAHPGLDGARRLGYGRDSPPHWRSGAPLGRESGKELGRELGQELGKEQASNDTLLLRVGAGDRAAFHDLYAAAAPRLFAICMALLRDRARAEEALQEGFVRIWERANSYDPEKGAALAWMTVVTRRVALNDLSRHKRPTRSLDDEDDPLPEIAADLPEQDPIGKGRLIHCLDRLEPERRRWVVLAYVHGYSHEELARRFDRPLGTMKSALFRSLAELRKCVS